MRVEIMKRFAMFLVLASMISSAVVNAQSEDDTLAKVESNIELELTYQKAFALKSVAWEWKKNFLRDKASFIGSTEVVVKTPHAKAVTSPVTQVGNHQVAD